MPRYFSVLAEDDTFLAIDKPSGLPIHTTAKFFRNTLTALLRERYPGEPLQVCHRLDRETSGVMLIARGREAGSRLKQAFARRKVDKTYLALCHGIPSPPTGVIDAPMKLLDTPIRIAMGIAPDGLPAVTRYQVLRAFAAHALLAAEPQTGRQHQIRVHLAHVGHPIVGDKIYRAGEREFAAFCDGGMTPELLEAFDGLPGRAARPPDHVSPSAHRRGDDDREPAAGRARGVHGRARRLGLGQRRELARDLVELLRAAEADGERVDHVELAREGDRAIDLAARSPCPRIFMPITPFPACFISPRTPMTVAGSASMCAWIGLMRA